MIRALPASNTKVLASFVRHASITITLDRYEHLMPGNEEQAAWLLDTYMEGRAGVRQSMRRSITTSSTRAKDFFSILKRGTNDV